MEPVSESEKIIVDGKSKLLLWILFLAALASFGAIVWRFLVLKDFTVIEEVVDKTSSLEE